MIRSTGIEIIKSITSLANKIIKKGSIPSDQNLLHIVILYKGKGDALSRDNYRGLKLLAQVMKITERVLDSVIRFRLILIVCSLGLCQVDTIDAIFILCKLQEKHLGININPCILPLST